MKKSHPDTAFEQERVRLHRKMMSTVSHDLKTPLACIIGALEIYKRTQETLSPEKKEILINTALDEAHRLDCFVTSILDIAHLENKALAVKKEICPLCGDE